MLEGFLNVKPEEIEKKSFEILSEELGERSFPEFHEGIIKRVIHTTADFEYVDTLEISLDAVVSAIEALKSGGKIITDTRMAYSGIHKKTLERLGSSVSCFIEDEVIAQKSKDLGVTRSSLCMEKAAEDRENKIYVVGNAPTALIRICELIEEGKLQPDLVVGVPVGFVNVVESKELLRKMGVPFIISRGRKGGSNVAAAIINAIMYQVKE